MKRSFVTLSLVILASLILSACAPTAPAPAPTQAAAPTQAPAAQPEPTQPPAPTAAPAPTDAPAAAPTAAPEPTVAPEAAAPAAEAAKTLRLPDLKGQKVAAVTENAYTPLNFVDPATGKAVGWEYDAVNEICRRLNCTVDWKLSSWDAMIPAVKDGQFDVGMDGITINDERKAQVDFSDPYMTSQQFMLVRGGRGSLHGRQDVRRGPQAADRRPGGHDQLLLRGLQRPRRRREEPAHQALRDVRRLRPGLAVR